MKYGMSVSGFLLLSLALGFVATCQAGEGVTAPIGGITVRTEIFPRPPSSGATYYIYERDGKTVCTKLAVCDKYGHCDTEYHAGVFKTDEDVETGNPYGSSPAVLIPPQKVSKHVCLAKYVKDAG